MSTKLQVQVHVQKHGTRPSRTCHLCQRFRAIPTSLPPQSAAEETARIGTPSEWTR